MATVQTLDELAGFVRAGSFAGMRAPVVTRLDGPSRVMRLERFELGWQVRGAARVELQLRGLLQGRHEVAAEGRMALESATTGTLAVDLIAVAEATDADEAAAVRTLHIEVRAARATLTLSAARLYGTPGQSVRLLWTGRATCTASVCTCRCMSAVAAGSLMRSHRASKTWPTRACRSSLPETSTTGASVPAAFSRRASA